MTGKSSGLTFHYPPYAVGPYVEGAVRRIRPLGNLEAVFDAGGLAIFGGARVKSDDDEQQ